MIRVMVVESNATVRQSLMDLCQEDHALDVLSTGAALDQAIDEVDGARADLVIATVSSRPDQIFAAVRQFKRRRPETPVVLLSLYHHDSYALSALEAGASGYLMLEHARQDLVETIRMLALSGPLAASEHFAAI